MPVPAVDFGPLLNLLSSHVVSKHDDEWEDSPLKGRHAASQDPQNDQESKTGSDDSLELQTEVEFVCEIHTFVLKNNVHT